jgi:hypothetical protein
MHTLIASLHAFGTDGFAAALQRELRALPPGRLPLAGAAVQGGHVDDATIGVSVLSAEQTADTIDVNLGVFFTEIVGGCSCGDDPYPSNGYCELRLRIDRRTGAASFTPRGP